MPYGWRLRSDLWSVKHVIITLVLNIFEDHINALAACYFGLKQKIAEKRIRHMYNKNCWYSSQSISFFSLLPWQRWLHISVKIASFSNAVTLSASLSISLTHSLPLSLYLFQSLSCCCFHIDGTRSTGEKRTHKKTRCGRSGIRIRRRRCCNNMNTHERTSHQGLHSIIRFVEFFFYSL